MANKDIAVLLYGADRQLWTGSGATLIVRDLNDHGEGIRVLARKELDHSTIQITLKDLAFDSGQTYGLTIEAKGHRPAAQLIRRSSFLRQEGDRIIERPDIIFRLMMAPRRPKSSDLDTGYERLVARGSALPNFFSEDDYKSLKVAQQMAFLNIEAKLRETYIGHDPLLSYVTGMRAADPDRLFLLARSDLKPLIERSADFAGAAGHGVPEDHPGFPACPDSWKHTQYEFGNIQLSFSKTTELWPAESDTAQSCFGLDTDIDLERGILHVGEWLDNNVLHQGKKTDQTLVYALLFAQGILPVYR